MKVNIWSPPLGKRAAADAEAARLKAEAEAEAARKAALKQHQQDLVRKVCTIVLLGRPIPRLKECMLRMYAHASCRYLLKTCSSISPANPSLLI